MEKLGVKVPEGQKEKLEEIASEGGYPNRSELVREMIRDLINRNEVKSETVETIRERKRQVEEGEISEEDIKSYEEFREEAGLKE